MTRKNRNRGMGSKPVPYSQTMGTALTGGIRGMFAPNLSRERKSIIEDMYFRTLTELSVNRFKWTNLPPTVDERFLELVLFQSGLAVFYDNADFGYLALRGSGEGQRNMYDTPTSYRVIGNTFISESVAAKDCVAIWGNSLRIPDSDVVMVYATKLAEIDRTIEINLQQMRNNLIVIADESERLSFENLLRQRDEGVPVVFGSRHLDLSKIQAIPTILNENQVLNLQVAKSKMWNECMTLLGINNANQDKRERLVAGEVHANDEQVESTRSSALRARQSAVTAIVRKYPDLKGLKVEWDGSNNNGMDYLGREGAGSVNIHNASE